MDRPRIVAGSARILLVEDDESFAALLKAYLRTMALDASSSPVATTTQHSGVPKLDAVGTLAAAKEQLSKRHYDLIIADLNLPDSQGLATLNALREPGGRLILIITGDDDVHTAQAALERGAYDFLPKTQFTPAELKRLVRLAAIQSVTVSSLRNSEIGVRRLLDEQAQHLAYQEKIARFGQTALALRDAGQLIAEAVQIVLEGLKPDAVAYVELAAAGDDIVARAVAGVSEMQMNTAPLQQGTPLHRVLRDGELKVLTWAQPDLPFPWAARAASALIAGVRGERGVRGALCVLERAQGDFGDATARFLDVAASVLSAGLQRIDSEGRLAFLAQFDSLTRLPNRALLADRFNQMIVQAKRRGSVLGVLFIDLDDFKTVNDSLGHAAGDELLVETGRRLQECVRAGDTVARMGGDEYAVILADLAKPEDAAVVGQKINASLAQHVVLRGQEVFVTASIGIASFPADGDNAESLLGAADAAMYRAKQSGRNGYQFFTSEMNQRTRARAQLGSELHRALERAEFALVFQPKYDLASGVPSSAEALLRWKHPERGMVSPAQFIPILEETGLIVDVGEWVLRQACAEIVAWQEAGLRALPIAVNLSARQFRQHDLDSKVVGVARACGVPPDLLELEITESHLMADPDHAVRVMRSMHDCGLRIAIDDFGTGYSSLAYLTRFPLSSLKIDRSFVAGALTDPAAAAIVRAIIEMAHTLGFRVVAEGVETERQVQLLRGLGCEEAQGYYFAKPMPAAQLAALLERSGSPAIAR